MHAVNIIKILKECALGSIIAFALWLILRFMLNPRKTNNEFLALDLSDDKNDKNNNG